MSLMTIGAGSWRRAAGGGAFDPSILTGVTFAWSALSSDIYKGISTSDGVASSDGDPVQRIDSDLSIPRCFSRSTGGLVVDDDAFGTGRRGLEFGSASRLDLFAKPSGTSNPSSAGIISDLWTTTAKNMIFAGKISNAPAGHATNPWIGGRLLGDSGSSCGLFVRAPSGSAILEWFNYGGTVHKLGVTVPLGTPFVLICRHSGGLGVSLNNGAFTTGSTSSTSGAFNYSVYHTSGASPLSGAMAGLVVCNANNSDSDLMAVASQLGAMMGLSI